MLQTKIHILFLLCLSTLATSQNMPSGNIWGSTRLFAISANGDTTGYITIGQLPFASSTAVSGTPGYIPRFSAANVLGNSSIYETGGSVGVNSLNLYGTFTVGGASYINGASTGSTSFLGFKNATTDFGFLGSDNALNAGTAANLNLAVYGNNSLFLQTNGTKRLTIDGAGLASFSGNVTVPTGTTSGHAVNKGQLTTEVPSVIAGLTDLPIGNRYTQREWRKTINMGGSYAANAYWDICTITQGSLQGSLFLNAIIEGSGFGQSMYAELPLSYNMDWYPTVTGSAGLTVGTWYEIPVRNFQNRHLLPNESDISFLFQFNGNTINLRLRSNIAAPGTPVFKFTMIYKGLITDSEITDLNTTGTFSTAVTRIVDVMGTRVSQIAVPNRMAIKTSLLVGNPNITTLIPSDALQVTGTGNFSGTVIVANGTSSTHAVNLSQLQGAISGTTSYIPKFTGTNSIGNSQIYDNGTSVGVGNTNSIFKFDVTGTFRLGDWQSKSYANTFNGGYEANTDNLDYWINYTGYLDGFTRSRNTVIGNGKGGYVAFFSGVNKYIGLGGVPSSQIHAFTTSEASPSSNTTQFRIESSSTNNVNIGLLSGAPYAGYIQVGGGSTYPLSLQPNGSNVYIGASTDNGSSAKLQVNGNVSTSGTETASRFISNVANGTQPYQTTSTTLNANLNANFVQGLDSAAIGQRTQKNTWTQSNTFTGTTNLNGATTNLSAALRSDYSDGSDNLVYGNSSNDLKYTSYQSILNRTQANDTFAMTTASHVFTLSTNQVNTVDIGIYTTVLDTIDIRLASGLYDDNQMISITTDKSLIAGQGDKIKITNSSGVTQLEIVNDVTSTLTKDYEVNTTSFGKMNLQIQYSKKRAKWRIISFKLWDNL